MAIEAAEISRASDLVGELARREIAGLSHADLMAAHDAVARLGRLAGVLEARFAGEIARRSTPDLPGGGLARRQGFGNAGLMIARVTGGTQASALRAIEAGMALVPDVGLSSASDAASPDAASSDAASRAPRYPAVARAALAGDLSVDAAGLITAGLDAIADRVPSDLLHQIETKLVSKAARLAVHEVRRMVATAIARADVQGHEDRERRQYDQRYFAWSEDVDGMVTFTGKVDAVTAAPIRTVIEQIVTQGYRVRRGQDPTSVDQRTVGQMRADALFEVCRHALGCKDARESGVRTTIIVRMSVSDLERGSGLGSIDGTAQPVSVGQLRRLAGDAGIIPAVLSGEGETLDLGRTVRMFTRAQRLALLERDGGCAKCHAPPEHCEAHHIRWWERGGLTNLSNGVMLCTRCHHDVHRQGWEIRIESGRVSFVPPPLIDSLRRAIAGGLAAIDIGESGVGLAA